MNVIKTLIKMVTRKCEHCNKKCMVMSEGKKLKCAQEALNGQKNSE